MSAYEELDSILRNSDVGYLDHRYGADAEPAAIADGILKGRDTDTLREAADAVALDRDSTIPSGGKGAYRRGMTRAVELLRRMADAAEQGEKDTREGESTPQPADFFQPGHTYAYDADGFTAPELITRFRVQHITTHPTSGKRMAFGWLHTPDTSWTPYAEPADEWPGSWTDITDTENGGDAR